MLGVAMCNRCIQLKCKSSLLAMFLCCVGCKATLRKHSASNFLDKLLLVILPHFTALNLAESVQLLCGWMQLQGLAGKLEQPELLTT